MNTYDLKITVDADCDLYIDGEMITRITRGLIYKNNLQEGEYIIQAKTSNPKIRFKEIISLDCNKVINISFSSIVQKSPHLLNKLKFHYYIDKDTSLEGYMDIESKVITIPAAFKRSHPFNSYDIALVESNGKYGFIDKSGKFVLSPIYDKAEYFDASNSKGKSSIGYYILTMNNNDGIINEKGEWIIKPEDGYQVINTDIVIGTSSNKAYFVCKNSQNLLTVHNGEKFITNFRFNKLEFSDDRYIYSDNGKYGILKLNGLIYASGFDRITKFNKFGYAWAEKDNTKGWINHQGKFAYIPPTTFDAYGELSFDGNCGLVAKDKKVTYIDTGHNLLLPFKYDSASPIDEDRALVVKDGLFGLIDSSFKEICPCVYSTFQKPGHRCMSYPLAIVSKDNKYGCIDYNGKSSIPCIYKDIRIIGDNVIYVKTESGQGMFVNNINQSISPIYDEIKVYGKCPEFNKNEKFHPALSSWKNTQKGYCIKNINLGCIITKKGNSFGLINKDCKEIIPTEYPIIINDPLKIPPKCFLTIKDKKLHNIFPDGKIIDVIIQPD